MGLVRIRGGHLVAVGTLHRFLGGWSELGQSHQGREHLMQVWIGAAAIGQKMTQVIHCRRNTLQKVLLTFEISTEAVGTQYLK